MSRERRKPSQELVREDLPPCKYFLSTGSTLLDLAVANRYPGGIGSGRITHIYGEESTAKSVIAQEVLGSAQRQGGTAIFEDAEHTLDFNRAAQLHGINIGEWAKEDIQAEYLNKPLADVAEVSNDFIYRVPEYIEPVFDEEIAGAIKLIEEEKLNYPVAMSIDSLSALPSRAEMKANLEDGTYGTSRAKQFSAGLRKYIYRMATSQLTVLAVDQTREAIGRTFGRKDTTSGGKAIRFYASTRIFLKHIERLKNKHGVVEGVKVAFEVDKNKVGPPMREGWFYVLFDVGIDDVRANLEWLAKYGDDSCIVSKKGGWWSWNDDSMQGINSIIEHVEENDLEEELRCEVARVWAIVHAPMERKKRHE